MTIEELRNRRRLSYLFSEFDDINLQRVINNNDKKRISQSVINFFINGSKLEYPEKSYFVAIVYAYMISKYTTLNFFNALSLEDLLPDDDYFIPYDKDRETYNDILNNIDVNKIKELPSTQKTIKYFLQEFLLGTNS